MTVGPLTARLTGRPWTAPDVAREVSEVDGLPTIAPLRPMRENCGFPIEPGAARAPRAP